MYSRDTAAAGRRLVVTTCLPLLLIAVMSFQFVPKFLHEILGVVWMLLVLCHLYHNRSFWQKLRRGRGSWNFGRLLVIFVDVLLLAVVLLVALAGLGISNYLLSGVLPLEIQRSIVLHQYHKSLSYALLILCGLHWGMHWQVWQKQWQKFVKLSLPPSCRRLLIAMTAFVVLASGVLGSFMNRVGDRLLMKHIFATEAVNQPGAIYVLLLAGTLGLYVLGGIVLSKWGKHR